jgi:hypothetical protein
MTLLQGDKLPVEMRIDFSASAGLGREGKSGIGVVARFRQDRPRPRGLGAPSGIARESGGGRLTYWLPMV